MTQAKEPRQPNYGCDSRCVEDFVDCMTTSGQEDDPICKTRQQNCIDECPL